MKLIKINNSNIDNFNNMFEEYLEELNQYFKIEKDEYGNRRTEWLEYFYNSDFHEGYYLEIDNNLAGFCLVCDTTFYLNDNRLFLSEFFINKKYRKNHYGKEFALKIFNYYKGNWELSVHPKNLISIKFWEKVISCVDVDYKKTYDIEGVFENENAIIYDFTCK